MALEAEEKPSEPDTTEPDNQSAAVPVSRAQAFFRIALVTLAMFGVLEVVARIVLHFRTKSLHEAAAADYPRGTYIPDFTARVDYRFINFYTADPERANNEAYDFDAFGFRLGPQKLRFEAPPKFKRIWMLGGSTVQGLGVRGDESIPAHLNKLLERDHSAYRVINMGQAGYTSTQELLLLIEMMQANFHPDAIVSYDGAAEAPFAGDIVETGAPDWEKRTPKARVLLDLQGGESSSALLPLALLRLTKMDDLMVSLARPHPSAAMAGDNWDVVAHRYLTTLAMIRSIADQERIPSLFFFQPILPYEDHYKLRKIAPDEERFRARYSPDEYKRCEAIQAEGARDLRARLGDRFFDIHEVFRGRDGEKLYSDPRHANGVANGLIAARIYDQLKSALPETP